MYFNNVMSMTCSKDMQNLLPCKYNLIGRHKNICKLNKSRWIHKEESC